MTDDIYINDNWLLRWKLRRFYKTVALFDSIHQDPPLKFNHPQVKCLTSYFQWSVTKIPISRVI